MAKFPEYSEIPLHPIVRVRYRFKTLVSNFGEVGEESRKQKWIYPKRDITVAYRSISKAHAATLWDFFLARKGIYSEFNFFLPEPEQTYPEYTDEYVGKGDGSTEVFNLPCKNSINGTRAVYVAGVPYTEDSDYTFTAGGGEDACDKISFDDSGMAVPADGEVIKIDFQGILKVRCVFLNDYLDFETFADRLVTVGVELRGLLNR